MDFAGLLDTPATYADKMQMKTRLQAQYGLQ